jgi:DNA-binding XRE family transcriptional regulator
MVVKKATGTPGAGPQADADGDRGRWWFEKVTERQMAAEIGARIAEARCLRGRSRRWLAEAAGVHTDTIRRIENGTQEPRTSTMVMIITALDVDHQQILGGFEWVSGPPPAPGHYRIERWSETDDDQ